MNLNERLEQCKKDIALLEQQKKDLEKQIVENSKPKYYDIDNLRVSKRRDSWYPFAIGINSYGLIPEPENNMPDKFTFALFEKDEIEKIIRDLQKLISEDN